MPEELENSTPEQFDASNLRLEALESLEHAIPVPVSKNTFTYAELHAKKDVQQKFIIPDLLPAHSVCLIIGEDGVGKTQLLAQLCACVCLGFKDFVGLPLLTEGRRCLFAATEDSKEKWINAFTKQMHFMAPEHAPADIQLSFVEAGNFDEITELKTELENELRKSPVELCVLDAFGDLFSLIDGEINSNSHARRLLSMLQQLCNTYNTTIIIIHHAAKTKIVEKRKQGKMFLEKNDSQGAGAITQKPRTILGLTHDPRTLSPDGNTYTNYLHVLKANLMGKRYVKEAVQLEFQSITLLHRRTGLIDIEMQQVEQQEKAAGEQPQNGRPGPGKGRAPYGHRGAKEEKITPQVDTWRPPKLGIQSRMLGEKEEDTEEDISF